MKLEEAAAPSGIPRSAGTGSPSKTTITVLDQLSVRGGSVLASSLLEGSWLGAGQQGDSAGLPLPGGCWPGLGLSQEPLPQLRALGRAQAQGLHPFTSAWAAAEPFSCCPSLGTPARPRMAISLVSRSKYSGKSA